MNSFQSHRKIRSGGLEKAARNGALIPWGSTTPLKAVGRTWDDLKDHHQEHHLYKLGRPKPHGPQAVDQRISQ